MPNKIEQILQDELVKRDIVKKNIFDALLKEAQKSKENIVSILAKNNISSEKEILTLLSEKLKIEFADLRNAMIDKDLAEKIPIKLASYYKICPLTLNKRTLQVAVSYPLDVKTLDEIRTQLGYDIETVLAEPSAIDDFMKRSYGLAADTLDRIISREPKDVQFEKMDIQEEAIEDIEKAAGDASVVQLINQIILEAYKKRATDIHIEPYRGTVRFRYRIDGILYDANVPKKVKNFLQQILSRIKIMSNLNIVERRLPQDGRAVVKIQDKALDLRISFIPTPFGEGVVIRILPTSMFFGLEKLGLSKRDLDKFNSFIESPHGIIFVTGPTGSGKTTSLYACLSKINTAQKKVITIEDPIEYEMSGVSQIQVSNEIGLNFARGLRSILRHDPDVIMVGEVRDMETAEIAIRVALTGHLVFSTLHTNDAASGITRLIDIGLETYLVASSVIAFIAQRLIRVICPHCKEEEKDMPRELVDLIANDLSLESKNDIKIFKGKGCEKCNFTGYHGRTAIYEILTVDEGIKELIMKKASASEIRRRGVGQGMRTLRQDGWRKVLEGITTPDEIARVTEKEEIAEKDSAPLRSATGAIAAKAPGKSVKSPTDRRVYMRLDDRINVRYRPLRASESKSLFSKKGKYDLEHASATKDISAGGILFISDDAPLINSIMELKLDVPSKNSPIQCLARVVRVEAIEANKRYIIGVFFLDISSKDRAFIDRYVNEELEKR